MVRGNFCLETSKVSGNTHGKALEDCGFKCCIWVPLCGLWCYCTGEGSYKVLQDFITFDYCYLSDVYALRKHVSF